MKLEIYFMNSKLTTEIKKDTTVKDLLNDLKGYLNTTDSNFILFDKNHIQLKESDIISIQKSKEKEIILYLLKSNPNKNILFNIDKKEDIKENLQTTELIMKCTNANKLLDLKKRLPPNNRINLLDIFDNRNNGPEENNGFDRLLNILQALEENNMGFRISINSNNNNNNSPVEADEKALRELQDMGFPEDRARQALINSRNDINRATEILLGEGGE